MVDMDWLAAMDSEIFREYAKNELVKMKAEAQQVADQAGHSEEEEARVLEEFEEFEKAVRASPKKLATFRILKEKFTTDPDYTSKVKSDFVNAVMMLNLD